MKICIVKLSAMGDIIHAMIVLQYIKEKLPNSQIDWLVEDSFQDILQNNRDISNILPIGLKKIKKNKKSIFEQIRILRDYSKNRYDIIIDMQGLLKSAIVSRILSLGYKKCRIIGFDKYSIRETIASLFYTKTINIDYNKNVIARNIKLISESLNINITKDEILNKKSFLFAKPNSSVIKNIIFIVGASRKNKIYPVEKFIIIANNMKNESIEVIWANKYEKEIALILQDKCDNIIVNNKMDLDYLKFKIQNSKLVIGGDTGPTHMAWATNTPSITIFGNTPEYRNTYETNINKVIKSKSKVNPRKLDYNDFSIKDIEPMQIVKIAKELLK